MPSRRNSAPISPTLVQRSEASRMRCFSRLPNWRRLAVAATSGSGAGMMEECAFRGAFIWSVMIQTYLFYSNLSKVGVSRHIGTGGSETMFVYVLGKIENDLLISLGVFDE